MGSDLKGIKGIAIIALLSGTVHADELSGITGTIQMHGGTMSGRPKWTWRNRDGEEIPPPPTWGTPAFSWFDPYKQKPPEEEQPEWKLRDLPRDRYCHLVIARNDVVLDRPELKLRGGMSKEECRKGFEEQLAEARDLVELHEESLAESRERMDMKRKALLLLEKADVKVE